MSYCARRDGDIQWHSIRGWMKMVYRHMIYSPETDKQIWHWFRYSWRLDNIYTHRQRSLKECSLCARWVLFVTPDSSSPLPLAPCCCWLLPCWQLTAYPALHLGAGPSPIPPHPRVDPIPLRSQATPHSSVGYNYITWDFYIPINGFIVNSNSF
jgi:hypothetical protein